LALITAARQLILDGARITMTGVATAVGVSEATAYRHFPDLPSLLREAFTGLWPDTPEELARVGDYADVPERVAQATDFLLRNVVRMQGAVRAMIASTITREEVTFPRPGKQFGLIDLAVAPLERPPGAMEPGRVTQLKLDLTVIMSAEALFTLTDLAGRRRTRSPASSTPHGPSPRRPCSPRHQPRATCPPDRSVRHRTPVLP
jgi:AcrR family transcriptional regulator